MTYYIEMRRGERRRIIARFAFYSIDVANLWRRVCWHGVTKGRPQPAARLVYAIPRGGRTLAHTTAYARAYECGAE